jgi:hypothetical protein
MVAWVAAASKFREKCKKPEKPMLAGDPKETPTSYVPMYPLLQGKTLGPDWSNVIHHPN